MRESLLFDLLGFFFFVWKKTYLGWNICLESPYHDRHKSHAPQGWHTVGPRECPLNELIILLEGRDGHL
jgi:hypothetical protein